MREQGLTCVADLIALGEFYALPDAQRGSWAKSGELQRRWMNEGILQSDADGMKLTEKGEAWVQMVLDTPVPVNKWVDPRKEETK